MLTWALSWFFKSFLSDRKDVTLDGCTLIILYIVPVLGDCYIVFQIAELLTKILVAR